MAGIVRRTSQVPLGWQDPSSAIPADACARVSSLLSVEVGREGHHSRRTDLGGTNQSQVAGLVAVVGTFAIGLALVAILAVVAIVGTTVGIASRDGVVYLQTHLAMQFSGHDSPPWPRRRAERFWSWASLAW